MTASFYSLDYPSSAQDTSTANTELLIKSVQYTFRVQSAAFTQVKYTISLTSNRFSVQVKTRRLGHLKVLYKGACGGICPQVWDLYRHICSLSNDMGLWFFLPKILTFSTTFFLFYFF